MASDVPIRDRLAALDRLGRGGEEVEWMGNPSPSVTRWPARANAKGGGSGPLARKLLVLVLVCVVVLQLISQASMLSESTAASLVTVPDLLATAAAPAVAAPTMGAEVRPDSTVAPRRRSGQGTAVPAPEPGWVRALALLRESATKYVIVEVKNGLGNRLRALASAMSVAAVLDRPLLLIWVCDLHCNCSFRRLFDWPLPFALLEEEIPLANLTRLEQLQMYNYMRPEPGAIKDAPILPDPSQHIYFKSGFVMNHPHGGWKYAQQQIQRLIPVEAVSSRLVSDKSMVGLHIRNVFDAPRDEATAKAATGAEAIAAAALEYGPKGASQLLEWRRASHWTNFVPRIESLVREHGFQHPAGSVEPADGDRRLRFYLAADSEEAYEGLLTRFPGRILITRRECASERCDFRDCPGTLYALIDMLNLARTRLILGSGWSSYSEVAAFIGGQAGRPVPILMAGRDFGALVVKLQSRYRTGAACCSSLDELEEGACAWILSPSGDRVRMGIESEWDRVRMGIESAWGEWVGGVVGVACAWRPSSAWGRCVWWVGFGRVGWGWGGGGLVRGSLQGTGERSYTEPWRGPLPSLSLGLERSPAPAGPGRCHVYYQYGGGGKRRGGAHTETLAQALLVRAAAHRRGHRHIGKWEAGRAEDPTGRARCLAGRLEAPVCVPFRLRACFSVACGRAIRCQAATLLDHPPPRKVGITVPPALGLSFALVHAFDLFVPCVEWLGLCWLHASLFARQSAKQSSVACRLVARCLSVSPRLSPPLRRHVGMASQCLSVSVYTSVLLLACQFCLSSFAPPSCRPSRRAPCVLWPCLYLLPPRPPGSPPLRVEGAGQTPLLQPYRLLHRALCRGGPVAVARCRRSQAREDPVVVQGLRSGGEC